MPLNLINSLCLWFLAFSSIAMANDHIANEVEQEDTKFFVGLGATQMFGTLFPKKLNYKYSSPGFSLSFYYKPEEKWRVGFIFSGANLEDEDLDESYTFPSFLLPFFSHYYFSYFSLVGAIYPSLFFLTPLSFNLLTKFPLATE